MVLKKTKQNKTKQVPMAIMALSFKIKNQQIQNKKLSFETNNPLPALKIGIFIYSLKNKAS